MLASKMQLNRLVAVALGVVLHTVARNFEIDMHTIPIAGLVSVLEMVYFYMTIKSPGATLKITGGVDAPGTLLLARTRLPSTMRPSKELLDSAWMDCLRQIRAIRSLT